MNQERHSPPTASQDSPNTPSDRIETLGGTACSASSLLDVLFEDGNEQMLRDAVAYLKDKICTPKHIYKMGEKEQWVAYRLWTCIERRNMPDDARERFLSTGDVYAGVFH